MIEAKIFKVDKVKVSEKIQECSFYIKSDVYISGIIKIDFIEKEIRLIVTTIKQLSSKKSERHNLTNRKDDVMDLTFEERLCILKVFFYEFFVKKESRVRFLNYCLEEFTFIQESSNTFCNDKSLIQNILMYSSICFYHNKRERLICALKDIQNNLSRRECKKFQKVEAKILPFNVYLTEYETYVCCEIINRMLRKQRYRGRIVDLTLGKNRQYKVFQYLAIGSI